MDTNLALGILIGSSLNRPPRKPIKIPEEIVNVFPEVLRVIFDECRPIILLVLLFVIFICVTKFIKEI